MPTWTPIALEDLKELGRQIDSVPVIARDEPDLLRKLNNNHGHEEWCLLRAPFWVGDRLVALVIRPRKE